MRDKYIELIKEYIKAKPEYRYLLSELKKDLMMVGATEEEFNEAIKQIAELPKGQGIIDTPSNKMDLKAIYAKLQPKVQEIYIVSKHHAIKRKNWIAAISVAVIAIILFVNISFKPQVTTTKSTATSDFPVKVQLANQMNFPVVYANVKPIDPDKIFSAKVKNVQLTVTGKPKKEVMGFFPYWMLPKQDQIDLSELTSISLFGLDVDGKGNIITQGSNEQATGGWNMWKDPTLDVLIKRANNQGLKIYLTLKSFDNSNIETLAQDDEAQKTLIANALYLVNSKNLDGINIDFEYTGAPDEKIRDGFTRLVTNLNNELKRQVPGSVLTIDTYLVSGSEKDIFDIPKVAANSDAFVIMAYDMHTPLGNPGPVSAMGGDTNIVGYVQNYLEQVDASKLILAVPYYGYDWPDTQASASADMVNILPYAEIADQSKNLQLSWDDTSETPYFNYTDNAGTKRIVHFDNVRSLGIKYDFINRKNLKGVGIWALGYDGQNQELEQLLIDKFINQ